MTPERRKELNAASAKARRERVEERERLVESARLGTMARLARLVEEKQDALVAAYTDALETGSTEALARVRAGEELLSRVHGRPTQRTEDTSPELPTSIQALMDMTPEERRARLIALSSDSPPPAP